MCLLAAVVMLDLGQDARRWSIPVSGLLDEPAHLSTAGLVLLGVAGPGWLRRHEKFALAALIASVAIDLDHILLYLRVHGIADGGRPYSHSSATVAALCVFAVVIRSHRPVIFGVAVGVLLHLVRDIATGPGLPLFWPLSPDRVRLSYEPYILLLVILAVVATGRVFNRRSSGGG